MVKQRRTERRGGVTVLRIGRCGARVYALRACFYGACLPVAGQHRGGVTVLRIGRRGAMVCALYGDAVDGSARGVRTRSEASVGAEEKGHGRGSKIASMQRNCRIDAGETPLRCGKKGSSQRREALQGRSV